ncbi:gastrula zinc finger protein XlCGF42.1-like isoform X2 [Daktulosphaira vitifoliae]|uniref:gastrula zinc finger protein XlCGF42.1-like isoform X2 n=1 Tax=Daktulosphaira vitifoliae TaxID=58002 RepID=UPI0021AA3E25|nr:gastrula zinc finger protein XlCGF42.1-like isoform X2 [Daktulosphaira vitifoliae]
MTNNFRLEDAILNCKHTFESILCASTTIDLKKSILERILNILQEYILRISENDINENLDKPYIQNSTKNIFENVELCHNQIPDELSNNKSLNYICCKEKITTIHKNDVYKCSTCKYQTFRKGDLKKHLKRHMETSNYFCNYCTRTFFDKYNLERHINANHTKQQKYSCLLCAYTTYLYDSMKRHEKIKHSTNPKQQFICSVCLHVSATRQDMNIHSYIHDQTKPFMCEECGSMFAIRSRLKTHQNTVHKERKHVCFLCKKSFQSMSLLKRHTVIHSRFKPYSCPYCSHTSNNQSNLTKHVRNIHSKTNFSYHKFT